MKLTKQLLVAVMTLSCFSVWSQSRLELAWVKGESTTFGAGDHGTLGVTSSTNTPGARYGGAQAVAANGDIYMFGGYGNNTTAGSGSSNIYWADLWKWDGTDWTWIAGSNVENYAGNFGTKGVAAPTNAPPAKWGAVAWIDSQGSFYVFGGANASYERTNDLWKWDGTNWTWLSGSSSSLDAGSYGTKGVESATNMPSSRMSPANWIDDNDNLFIHGGTNGVIGLANDNYSDTWKYTMSTGMWTWVSGVNTADDYPSYGTQNVASSTNHPGAKTSAYCFDVDGDDFYMYGGRAPFEPDGSSPQSLAFADLWKWDGTNWTWVFGPQTIDATTLPVLVTGPPSATLAGIPGGAPSGASQGFSGVDGNGDFWIFAGLDAGGQIMSSIWRLDREKMVWIYEGSDRHVAGPSETVNYGVKGVASATNSPDHRMDQSNPVLVFKGNSFYFFGGASTSDWNMLNDVWRVDVATDDSWNGTAWTSGSTPKPAMKATISASGAPGDFVCSDLEVSSGATLTINAGDTVRIYRDLINNGTITGTGTIRISAPGTCEISGSLLNFEGKVIVDENCTLVTNDKLTLTASSASSYGTLLGTGAVTGNVNSQTWLDLPGGSDNGRYYYLGSPFSDAVLSDFNESGMSMFSSNDATGSAWEWDASTAEWTAAGGANLASTAVQGKGYSIFAGNIGASNFLRADAGTIELSGTVVNTDVTIPLAYNNGQSSAFFPGGSSVSTTQGWNLVANPYPAQYDWDSPTVPANLGTAKYVWNGSAWETYNNGVGSGNRYLAPYQAFFVQYSADPGGSQNLTFSESKRVEGETVELLKRQPNGIVLHVTGMNPNVKDQVYVGFDPQSTTGFDPSFDAVKLMNGSGMPNVMVSYENTTYSICRVPYGSRTEFPVELNFENNGEVMEIEGDVSSLDPFSTAILEDTHSSTFHDLRQGSYSFVHQTGISANRFVLHLNSSSVSIEENVGSSLQAWVSGNTIEVKVPGGETAFVQVMNMAGQVLAGVEGTDQVSIPFADLPSGVYIVHTMVDGESYSAKVIK